MDKLNSEIELNKKVKLKTNSTALKLNLNWKIGNTAYPSWSPQVHYISKFQFHRLIDHDVSISNKNVQMTYSIHGPI